MKKVRVLFFNYEYPPLGGGAANATAYILQEYAKMPNLEVDLVTSSIDGDYHLEEISTNVRIHKLPIGKNAKNLHYQSQKDLLLYTWKAWKFAQNLCRKNHYDLSHSFFTIPCGAISWRLFRKYQIPYVISLRGSDVPGYSDRFGFIYKLTESLVKKIWNQAKAVVSNSQGLKELALKTDSNQQIEVIYNGIDTEKFFPVSDREDLDFHLTLGGTRITHRKGIKYLILALEKLLPKYPQIKMDIIGEGNQKTELEELVREKKMEGPIRFVGKVAHEKILSFYQRSKVFVLPSLNEGMSNAMLEALASGLPIVSTRTGGADELVEDGCNGFLVKKNDPDDLAIKIEKLILDPNLQKEMGRNSRIKAEQLSWQKVAEQYFQLYQKIHEQKNH